ncbi:kinase-like domain-containing protein [Glomus cerebriforme]|uniref:Kinase-like domain-containing protein n=1 Tax=Glomus cerebriforme TaxID=658196 RepID=A0A397THV7_9GLOM|nr:kinase-like domain-containing protein [Glomus cerebriforme]
MGAGCCKEEEIDFDAEVELSHFHLLRSVGKGAFGKVRVVQHKHTKVLYALKYINKAKCIKMRAVENIIQERRLLEEIEYPLVCNLRYAFQDDENLFMVLDLMLGGDLRFHLERQGNIKEEVVKFYVAEVSLGLHYLHSKKIVHRDLKPDNVLLDEKGHAHLTDFNIAVHFNERKPLTSVAGSMAYMAPEILTKRGYFDSVDWWSLGVVMYELLFSKRPFRGKTNPQLTQAILKDPLVFPENARDSVSEECLDCLRRFCERDISKRLGCGPNGLEDIKQHPWFIGIEWDKLDKKLANPPFVPDSKRANFDATHELEELLLEDNPLKAKKRANPNQDLSELSKEMRMMEEKFLVYDFTKMRRRSYYHHNNGMQEIRASRATRRKSGSRSSGSSTAVDRLTSNSSSPINMNFSMDTNATLLPVHPASAKLVAHGRQGSDLSAIGYIDEHKEKNRGDWLNERPASPPHRENGRMSGFGFGTMPSNEKISPIGASNESEYFSMKSYPAGKVSPSSSITTDSHKRSHSAYSTQANSSSLSPPPRIQSPVQKVYNSTSPSSSRPSSPNPQPSNSVRSSSPRLIVKNLSNANSLNGSPTEPISSQVHSPPPLLPPPNVPLPPPPNTFSTISSSSTLVNSNFSTSIYNKSSSRIRSLSPPSTDKRPTISTEQSPSGNKHMWENSSELDEGNHAASTSGTSAGSGFTSENANGIGISKLSTSEHYQNVSDVNTGSGALNAVGVPVGI